MSQKTYCNIKFFVSSSFFDYSFSAVLKESYRPWLFPMYLEQSDIIRMNICTGSIPHFCFFVFIALKKNP